MGIFGKPNIEKMEKKRDVNGLIKALEHKDFGVRIHAVKALSRIGDSRAIEPLSKALRDYAGNGTRTVSVHAAEALRKMNNPTAESMMEELRYATQRLYIERGSLFLGAQAAEEHRAVKRRAVKDLTDLARSGDRRALDALINALMKEELDIFEACDIMKRIGEPAFKHLAEALRDQRYGRVEVAKVLGMIRYKEAVPTLIEMLQDSKWPEVQKQAASALAKIGDERAVEPLIEALKDDYWEVRREAAYALGELGDKRALEPLLEVARSDPMVREEIRSTRDPRYDAGPYGWRYDEKHVAKESPVRIAALSAVSRIEDKLIEEKDVEGLVELLQHWDFIDTSVIEALGQIGDERAIGPLTRILKDSDNKPYHGTAQKALKKIRSRMRPSSPSIE